MALEALNTQTSFTKADDSWGAGKRSKRPRSGDSPPPPMTEEEYLAFCLILLAQGGADAVEEQGPVVRSTVEKVPELPSSVPVEAKPVTVRNSHTCVECGKSFSSYQALGGHKASHRKVSSDAGEKDKASASISESVKLIAGDGKAHECGICHMVFSSGQALGGHKRRHFEGKIVSGNKRSQGVEKTASTSEGGSRSRSEGSTKSAGAGQSNSSQNDRVNLFDLNSLPMETTTEEDDLLCRETAEEVLSPVLPSPAKRPKSSFDVLVPK